MLWCGCPVTGATHDKRVRQEIDFNRKEPPPSERTLLGAVVLPMHNKRNTPGKRQQRRKAALRVLKEALVVLTAILGAVKLLVEIVRALHP